MPEHLAIDGGTPVRTLAFPSWPVWGDRERALLLEALDSGTWGELSGDKVQALEDRFAAFQHALFALAVPNGTQALEVGFQALGIGPSDEVITTAYTFIATASAIFAVGAKPVFVDIDPRTNLIDPSLIESAITSRTRAIVPVHIGGQPCDLDGLLEVARTHGLPVVEDAAQAVGAEWKGTRVGAIGDLGAFSFQESKNLSGGEGGAIVTNRQELHELAWSLHNCGRGPASGTFDFERMGGNYRMTELTGALLLAQLERLDGQMAVRDRNAALLTDGLAEITGLTPTLIDERVTGHAWHLYQIRYDAAAFGGRSREDFIAALNAEGIPASAGYVPLTSIDAIRTALRDRFGESALRDIGPVPHAEAAGGDTIWLHQTTLLGSDDDTADILTACRKVGAAWHS
ncbi:MAG: DegT/DnrJ/EryC1/StrS family aminotransferase [Chloroflexota bacterium]|nr:DegT/DnrJ/EryC1/StrS family aminotransferase [Chloroflexota bacterium]